MSAEGDRRLWFAALVATTLLHLVLAATLPLSGDEAYYWDCSRHLDWSYFDQPPLVIWAMVPFRALLGETALAVRMPAIVASLATALMLLPLVRRFGGGPREAAAALVVLHLTPAFFVGSFYASTDVAMIAFYVAATWSASAIAEGDRRGWLGFGIAFGFGFLSKFSIVVVLAAVAAALTVRGVRRDLLRPTPWLAAAVSFLITLPVWTWGARHGWDNIYWQLRGRHEPVTDPLRNLTDLLVGMVVLVTPFLLAALATAWWRARRPRAPGRTVIRVAAAAPLVFFSLAALRTESAPHWPLPGLVPAVAILATTAFPWRRALTVAAGVLGVALSVAILVVVWIPETLHGVRWHYAGQEGRIDTSALSGLMGTDEIVAQIEARRREGELVASHSYSFTHELAFRSSGRLPMRLALVNRGKHGLASLYWYPPEELYGRDFMVVTEKNPAKLGLERLFASVEEDRPIEIVRRGEVVRRVHVIRCGRLLHPVPWFTRLPWRGPEPPPAALTPAAELTPGG